MDLAQEQVEAVDLMSLDEDLAHDLKRKLWLKIAEHVIEKEHNIAKAMEVRCCFWLFPLLAKMNAQENSNRELTFFVGYLAFGLVFSIGLLL